MFIVDLKYKVAIEKVDQYLIEHRSFLEAGYQKNYFMASGPKNPRTGGIILSPLKDRTQLEKFLSEDPFSIHSIADYEITEFTPVKFHPDFTVFV
jgi:uncharacterized protein YciI